MIKNCTFWGCSGLKKIDIPDSVMEIGESAFGGCEGLKILWKDEYLKRK